MTSILMWHNFETVRRWGKENGEKRRVLWIGGRFFVMDDPKKSVKGKIIKTLMDFDLK